ncbi:MAG: aminoglycoside phosphotransferase [Alphaproteobacteria bacterium]|nr:MAG: aminoglycoside phosphotransferase [Alphaproteobacteria bacterium]
MTGGGDPRQALARDFLARAGWAQARLVPLAGDASARRYARLVARDGSRAILMDASPERGEDVRPFLAVTAWLRARGFAAPEPLAADPERGLLLLEDLGEGLFARVCARDPGREGELYAAAVDVLVALHRHAPPAAFTMPWGAWPLRPYDMAALTAEAELLPEWYVRAAAGALPESARAAFRAALAEAVAPVAEAREVLVLRDYHAENLIWRPDRSGLGRVGLLDYQDALAGHPAYDLVSLIEDARRDTSPALRAAMLRRYARATGTSEAALGAACAALGAQRNAKIIGIFARLWLCDGKPQYLPLIPRVWDHLTRDLAQPGLEPLRRWVAAHVPPPTPAVLARIRGAA